MRIGVISDTHDHVDNIKKAVEIFNSEDVDLVLHCGDFIAPFAVKPLANLKMKAFACFGNNDGELLGLKKTFDTIGIDVYQRNQIVTWQEKNIFLMHEPDQPDIFAASDQFDLVCYGHTHQPDIHQAGNILVVNPGEACGWVNGKATIALVDLAKNEAKLIDLN